MFKKMMAILLVVGLLGVLPMLCGCENERQIHTESTTNSAGAEHAVIE